VRVAAHSIIEAKAQRDLKGRWKLAPTLADRPLSRTARQREGARRGAVDPAGNV
jgi:hypothetical protein